MCIALVTNPTPQTWAGEVFFRSHENPTPARLSRQAALALHDYAALLLREGSLESAQAIFKVSLQQDPLCVPSLLGLGVSLLLSSSPASHDALSSDRTGGGGGGGGEEQGEGRGLDGVRKDVLTIFARAHQIQPSHVGVQIELGDLLVEAGYEAEGCKLLHLALRDEGCSPRLCLALSRFYAESRFGWSGPGESGRKRGV